MFNRVIEKINEFGISGFLINDLVNINWLCKRENYVIPGKVLITDEDVYIII